MPLYSYAIESLTLRMNPRIKRLLSNYHLDKDITHEDVGYLIDCAARWETIKYEVNERKDVSIPINKGAFKNSESIELGEIINDIFTETDNLYATNIVADGKVYLLNTEPLAGSDTLDLTFNENPKVVAELMRYSMQYVKELQADFDKKNKGVVVEGYLRTLEKYNVKFHFTKDSDIEKVIQSYFEYKQQALADEIISKEKELNDLFYISKG